MFNSEPRYHLTDTEQEIMDVLWDAENGLNFQQLLDHMNEIYHKEWHRQTLRTFLMGLQKSSMIESRGSRRAQVFYPSLTREEYLHGWTRRLVANSYGNSLRNFLSAFAGDQPLTEEEAECLREMLDHSEAPSRNDSDSD